MNNKCPKCNAELQENARFCPHCMTMLDEKQNIEKPKAKPSNKKRTAKIISVTLVIALLITGITGAIVYNKKHSPICSFEQFKTAVPIVSEKMGIDSLWDEEGFIDAHYFEKEKLIQYTTSTDLGEAYLSLFFYNKGEEVGAYFCDIEQKDFNNAENILKCIVQSVSNYYYTDIDDIFDNEKLYPKKSLEAPFDSYYTDLLGRTEEYNGVIANGGSISTKYLSMTGNDMLVAFYVTERNDGKNILYDLTVEIERR